MCGIAGAADAVEDRAEARVSILNQSQQHRGPDHSVLARIGPFTLGNTRLAIQDPGPSGNQPFASLDGRYHCVFNGEIYNHRQLVDYYQLPVRTACDGEVIPLLWAKLGPASLSKLRGMYSIAIVDSLHKRLHLARDPFGIKPLYWRRLADGEMVFASEVRSLVRVARGANINGAAIFRYLRFGAMAAAQSPFEEITALPPNSVASFSLEGRAVIEPILPDGPLVTTDPSEDLGSALMESIDLHLAADVPTALLLSAGTDSAAIAAIGHRLGRTLNCLTIATQDAVDESDEAWETARRYGHRFERIPAALGDGDVGKFFQAMQRPTIDGLNTYIVSRAVHDAGFKVALSGLGGDEAVGGYGHFRLLKYLPALRMARKMPDPVIRIGAEAVTSLGLAGDSKVKRLLSRGGPFEGGGLSLLRREILHESEVTQLTGIAASGDAAPPEVRRVDEDVSFRAMVAAEIAIYLQATLLPDADAFSMTSSVELRVPFVDTHVFAASLGLAGASSRCPGKAAIGASLNDPYLRRLANRRKRGFSVPMQQWMTGTLASVLRAAEDRQAPVWSILDRRVAERAGLVPLAPAGRWANAWVIAALNAWLGTVA